MTTLKTYDQQTGEHRAPSVPEGETILHDEPGRVLQLKPESNCDVCFRAYHFRVTKWHGSVILRVRHGGGDESFRLSCAMQRTLANMDSDTRYFTLHAIMDAHHDGSRGAAATTSQRYNQAFVDGRLKKRKQRGGNSVKVWIEPAPRAQQ